LAELRKTPYGTLNVYYTGADPRYLTLAPRQYYFFGRQRGYVGDQQVAAGREVWAAAAAELSPSISSVEVPPEPEAIDAQQAEEGEQSNRFTNLCSVELDPYKVYQLCADATDKGEFRFVVFDDRTGAVIQRITSGEAEEPQRLEGLFKTSSGGRIRLAMRLSTGTSADPLPFSRISLREIAPL
ncbi:MAG TPA: hypothetical protein VNS63_07110, partial [Blastocatellia bacterium]|nr:hypothetical protein [Blastocatellia bacterium]